jgi:hypothetical protein
MERQRQKDKDKERSEAAKKLAKEMVRGAPGGCKLFIELDQFSHNCPKISER